MPLACELEMLSDVLPEDMNTCLLVLQCIFEKKLQNMFPNVTVALRIFLSMTVSLASAELICLNS
jgi:hypothetical protein